MFVLIIYMTKLYICNESVKAQLTFVTIQFITPFISVLRSLSELGLDKSRDFLNAEKFRFIKTLVSEDRLYQCISVCL